VARDDLLEPEEGESEELEEPTFEEGGEELLPEGGEETAEAEAVAGEEAAPEEEAGAAEEAAGEEAGAEEGYAPTYEEAPPPAKPKSDAFTVMLILSFLLFVLAGVLAYMEMDEFYKPVVWF
jgi:hypothetical protein